MGSFPAFEMEVESDFSPKLEEKNHLDRNKRCLFWEFVPISQGTSKKESEKKCEKNEKKTSSTFGAKGKAE